MMFEVEINSHKASSECCNPVPDITTSQMVSLRDSIVRRGVIGKELHEEIPKEARALGDSTSG